MRRGALDRWTDSLVSLPSSLSLSLYTSPSLDRSALLQFVSSIAYESAIMEVHNAAALKASPKFAAYELEDDALVGDLANFALTNAIYACLVEGHAAEVGLVWCGVVSGEHRRPRPFDAGNGSDSLF